MSDRSVFAFKGHQVRVYGNTIKVKDPVFKGKKVTAIEWNEKVYEIVGLGGVIGTAIDPEKKQDAPVLS